MRLRELKISVHSLAPPVVTGATSRRDISDSNCVFCGQAVGLHAVRVRREIACVLCGLVQSLHRPTIDEEVRMIWLPEMSQAALNVLIRKIHIELRELGESVCCGDTPQNPDGPRPTLYIAQRILLERGEAISERLGSSRASDFAEALMTLKARHVDVEELPLGGLRVLPAGRLIINGINVYDEIVDSWRGQPNFEDAVDFVTVMERVS